MRPNEEEADDLQSLLRESYPVPAPTDQFANRLQQQLLAMLPAENWRPAPARRRNRISLWIGGLTVRQRIGIALTGAGVVAVVGLMLLWGGIAAEPVSAMEQMAENIRQAKSYKVTMIMKMQFVQEPGKPPTTAEMTQIVYWIAPKSYRMESKGGQFTQGQDTTDILPAGKPGIHLDRKTKKFQREPAQLGRESPLMMLDKLSTFSGKADRKLGTKEINGKKAWGFEIDGKKIDPDAYPGTVEIWLAAGSDLPIALSYEMKWPELPTPIVFRMEHFEWNIDLDQKLFDPTPPDGYRDDTRKPASVDEQARTITVALKTYAQASGGHYPRVKVVYGDVICNELTKLLGIQEPPRTRDEKVAKVQQATAGFAAMSLIFRYNSDAAYYGRTVGPKDKDKVLFRWKLEDGRHEVIFGDLRSATVTAEKLRTLEEK